MYQEKKSNIQPQIYSYLVMFLFFFAKFQVVAIFLPHVVMSVIGVFQSDDFCISFNSTLLANVSFVATKKNFAILLK
jgi:membrane protein DedA with SNARE-associated domain